MTDPVPDPILDLIPDQVPEVEPEKPEKPEKAEKAEKVKKPTPLPAPVYLAERYAGLLSGEHRYTPAQRDGPWRHWDGARWADDLDVGILRRCVSDLVHSINSDGRRPDWAYLYATSNLLSLEPAIRVSADRWDARPYLVATPDGTIDLRSGQMRVSDPEDLLTKRTAVQPTTEPAPIFQSALEWAVPDGETRLYLQRFFGSMLVARAEPEMAILHGKGLNGKSFIVDAIQAALGDDLWTALPSTLLTRRSSSEETSVLIGRRAAFISEAAEGRLRPEMLKAITSGDSQTARILYVGTVNYRPVATVCVTCNDLPDVTASDFGTWRRITPVLFGSQGSLDDRAVFAERKTRMLSEELGGIMAWLVEGARSYLEQGLSTPAVLLEARKVYQGEEDLVGSFIEEQCVIVSGEEISSSELYGDFVKWSRELGHSFPPVSANAFGRQITSGGTGIGRRRNRSVRFYAGVTLKSKVGKKRFGTSVDLGPLLPREATVAALQGAGLS